MTEKQMLLIPRTMHHAPGERKGPES